MLPFRSVRRAVRSASVVLSAAAVALTPAAARAQPACAAGALATYLAPGFACRIDGWAFDEFDYYTFADASPSVTTFFPEAEVLRVVPFRRVEAGGRVAVGFDFLTLVSSVGTTLSQRGDERGTAVAQLQFLGRALTPAAGLIGARAELTAMLVGDALAATFASAQSFAYVDALLGTGNRCLEATSLSPAGGGTALDAHAGACAGEPVREVFALVGNIAHFDRRRDDRPAVLSAYTSGSVQSVTFVTAQVVPEPSTAALAAAGLLGVAGAAGRARARARRGTPARVPMS